MNRLKIPQTDFAQDQNGTVAIFFGFAILIFCVLIGLGVDGGRATVARSRTAKALDAATLAATRALMTGSMTDHDIDLLALDYFNKNVRNGSPLGVTYSGFHMAVDHATKTIALSVKTRVPTTFGRVTGVKSIDFPTIVQATYSVNDIELGLVLDTTGSMADPSSGGGGKAKIEELKVAAAKMFDILLPDAGAPGYTRIGIAPFAASVNAGPFADAVSHGTSAHCVVERTGADAWTDADPLPNGEGLKKAPGSCPPGIVLPLTDDKAALNATVSSLKAAGSTAGHLGTAWGWYLISPNWAGVWPSSPKPYGTKNLVKSIVVMTDGSYNTYYYNGKNSPTQAINVCDSAKAAGVLVYTVGFTSPPDADATLDTCASIDPNTGKKNHYHAESEAELEAAFTDIATKLSMLRLSK